MNEIKRKAYAKINLTLDVLRKRPDGYHDLRMVMQSVGVYDVVTCKKTDDGSIRFKTDSGFLSDEDSKTNLCVKNINFDLTKMPLIWRIIHFSHPQSGRNWSYYTENYYTRRKPSHSKTT